MGVIRTGGIITKEVKYGESSRIVTIITREYGKISAIANNVRTGKSKLLSGLGLFVYSDFFMYESKGKNGLYRINEINVIEPFKSIRESIDKMAYASYFAEVTNKTVTENNPDIELLRLLLNALYILDREAADFGLLKAAFEIKAAGLCGYAPSLFPCGKCGAEEGIMYIDPMEGTGCCEKCGRLLKKPLRVNKTLVSIWQFMGEASLKQAVSLSADAEIIKYLSLVTESYLSVQLDTEFKTLKFLKNVVSI